MDLKSFSNTEPYAGYRDEEILKEQQQQKENKPIDEAGVKDAINHYSTMSTDQLMVELAKQVGSQKAKGNTNSMLETIEKIKPLLNADQKDKLENVLKQVGM